jgi:hypothetical protein
MLCFKCGYQTDEAERFCRRCGSLTADLRGENQASPVVRKGDGAGLVRRRLRDPDELIGNGIGAVIVGDGFLMVAVILSATQSAISSLLWLLLLIPAFFLFGKGFADVFQARQIRRQLKHASLSQYPARAELAHPTSLGEVFRKSISGEQPALPSVTERTTRELK